VEFVGKFPSKSAFFGFLNENRSRNAVVVKSITGSPIIENGKNSNEEEFQASEITKKKKTNKQTNKQNFVTHTFVFNLLPISEHRSPRGDRRVVVVAQLA
jgi:hypothetical protein